MEETFQDVLFRPPLPLVIPPPLSQRQVQVQVDDTNDRYRSRFHQINHFLPYENPVPHMLQSPRMRRFKIPMLNYPHRHHHRHRHRHRHHHP
jgi:hypothetical protein